MRMSHKTGVAYSDWVEYGDVGNPVNKPGYISCPTVKGLDVGDTSVYSGVGQPLSVGFAINLMTPSLIKGKVAYLLPDVRMKGFVIIGKILDQNHQDKSISFASFI